jgi:diaminopimelate dehydrogenase
MINMKKNRVAIVGYGHVGKYVVNALAEAADLELVGIVEQNKPLEVCRKQLPDTFFTDDIAKIKGVDIAILCLPSVMIPEVAKEILKSGIGTVDCFDMYGDDLLTVKKDLHKISVENRVVSISAAGWDPGTDSIIRTIFEIAAPKGITYTNFGPGMSMGHTVAAKSVPGVKNALSITIPEGFGFHKRCVYVECEDGVNFDEVELNIKKDRYFFHDLTYIIETDDVDNLADNGHSVVIERKGAASQTGNQRFTFESTVSNPAVTAQIMVGSARAAMKQQPGNYLLPEIAPIDLLEGDDRELLLRKLV